MSMEISTMKIVGSRGEEWKEYMVCGFAIAFVVVLAVVGIYGASEPVNESGSEELVFSKGTYAPVIARKLLTSNSTSDYYGGDEGDGSIGGNEGDGSTGGDEGDGSSDGGNEGDGSSDGGDEGNGSSDGGDEGNGSIGGGSTGGDEGDGSNIGGGGDEGAPNRIGAGSRSPCSKESIILYQGPTTPLPNGIPTYTVEIQNVCLSESCRIAGIHVRCGWFSSARLIDPSVFRRVGYNDCLVNDGHPLSPGDSLSFQYANTFKYPMSVSSVAC